MNHHIRHESTSALRQIASRPSLYQAWRKVRANRGAAGIDAICVEAFEKELEANLKELSRNLLNRTYEPMPARYVNIPKPDGRERELAIPTVRDRVAQRALLDIIEPIFESKFLDCSYAFRPGRSVEMAIQKIVVARAQGFRWTVDSDIRNFFPSMDHSLLLEQVATEIRDNDILWLINLWLDAGVLDGSRPTAGWIRKWKSMLAGVNLALRDSFGGMLDGFLAERLGASSDLSFDDDSFQDAGEDAYTSLEESDSPRRSRFSRLAAQRLLQDGLLFALARGGAIKHLLTAKVIGIGGIALLLAAATPPALRRLQKMTGSKTGALQGSPISPLLSNVYLHPFDQAASNQAYRLIRYCDDFVILCRTESEAREARLFAEENLKRMRLTLNPDKTCLVAPEEEFNFLGYTFESDGRVVAPPNIPRVVSRQVVSLADRFVTRTSNQINSVGEKTGKMIAQIKDRLRNR